MEYRVRIHVELFPNVDFEYVFLDLTKNSKCLEHLRDLRARFAWTMSGNLPNNNKKGAGNYLTWPRGLVKSRNARSPRSQAC